MDAQMKKDILALRTIIQKEDNRTLIWIPENLPIQGWDILTGFHDEKVFRLEGESLEELEKRTLAVHKELRKLESPATGQTDTTHFFSLRKQVNTAQDEAELDKEFQESKERLVNMADSI